MSKNIKQFRYKNNDDNTVTKDALINGSAFEGIKSITQLGIQALPGTKFYLLPAKYEQGSYTTLTHSTVPIMIGSTGIYELNLTGLTTVPGLRFEEESLNAIANSTSAMLLIDIVYEEDDL